MGSVASKRFLSVDVKHDFYENLFSKDLDIIPTRTTQDKMRDQKLLFKLTNTGFKMYYRAVAENDATPFTPVSDGLYSFVFSVKNKVEFLNITNLDQTSPSPIAYSSGKIVRFYNSVTTTNALAYELLNRLMPEKFTYDFSFVPLGAVKLKIKDASGTPVYTSPLALVADDAGVYHSPVDLSALPPGKFSLIQMDGASEVATEEVYVDSSLVGRDILGVLDIKLETGQPFGMSTFTFANFVALANFPIQFVRRESKWKYFIVNKSLNTSFSSATFTITDTRTIAVNTTVYGASPNAFGSQSSVFQLNGLDTRTIVSTSAIPFFEKPQPNLKLSGYSLDIITHLPNPTRQAVSADPTDFSITNIFVYI